MPWMIVGDMHFFKEHKTFKAFTLIWIIAALSTLQKDWLLTSSALCCQVNALSYITNAKIAAKSNIFVVKICRNHNCMNHLCLWICLCFIFTHQKSFTKSWWWVYIEICYQSWKMTSSIPWPPHSKTTKIKHNSQWLCKGSPPLSV